MSTSMARAIAATIILAAPSLLAPLDCHRVPFLVAEIVESHGSEPDLSTDSFGSFAVVWQDKRNGKDCVLARHFDATGREVGGEILIRCD